MGDSIDSKQENDLIVFTLAVILPPWTASFLSRFIAHLIVPGPRLIRPVILLESRVLRQWANRAPAGQRLAPLEITRCQLLTKVLLESKGRTRIEVAFLHCRNTPGL